MSESIESLQNIPSVDFLTRINHLFDKQWFLLTSGNFDKEHFNTMTISWGSLGIMWNKPFAMVVVRPTRYTYEFMNQYDDFTLSAFPKQFHNDLALLGTKSGKDGDKIAETKLHPVASEVVKSPTFAEAELILECKKIYWDDMKPENFLDKSIFKHYKNDDEHRIYFGETLKIRGASKFL